MESENKCVICEQSLCGSDVFTVTKKGLNTLVQSSKERNDGKVVFFEAQSHLKLHVKCRKEYTRQDSINKYLRLQESDTSKVKGCDASPVKNKLRSKDLLDVREKCLFCLHEISEATFKEERKKPKDKRHKISKVTTITSRDTIIKAAQERNDEWGNAVKKRVENVIDLVAADAVYHQKCFTTFLQSSAQSKKRPGRPLDEDITELMNRIFQVMEESDECQWTIEELIELAGGCEYVPNEKSVKARLKEKYADEVILVNTHKRNSTVCFKHTGYKILTGAWYEERKSNENEERLRIVQAAADIVCEDIRSQFYETGMYPPTDNFLGDVETAIPNTLKTFLDAVIMKKKKSTGIVKKKCASIAHQIIGATRPRSFLSPLLLGLAVFLHRKFESKNLITTLANLGMCASYKDVQFFQATSLEYVQENVKEGAFAQYVFDNADFNANTLDGLNTIHVIGGIKCITPKDAIMPQPIMSKKTTLPTTKEVAEYGQIQMKPFEGGCGELKKFEFENLHENEQLQFDSKFISVADCLWFVGKYLDIPNIGSWNGFMQEVTKQNNFQVSEVLYLPFINLPPSSYDGLHTAICTAIENCLSMGQKTCIITFDQPLYMKAKDIACTLEEPQRSSVVIRLGGFHLLMSFLGCIGYIMSGSGLKDILSLVYASNTVDKMLEGRAYSRALRGHHLMHLALAKLILSEVDISKNESDAVISLLNNFKNCVPNIHTFEDNEDVLSLTNKFQIKIQEFEEKGKTAQLWVQYFTMVSLLKNFIRSERTGDWNLHLNCVKEMIPFFHACGHFAYAKSCHIYLQDMVDMKSRVDPIEYEKFSAESLFTIRRSEKYWAGVWSDMTIEQTLMKTMKSIGGLTHGRGMTESVMSKWILSMPTTNMVCDAIEKFSQTSCVSSDQHTEMRDSRMGRDDKDVSKIFEYLCLHSPFPETKFLMSLTSGIVGDESVNCYKAYEVGKKAESKVFGKTLKDLKLRRGDRVLSISTMTSAVKIRDTIVPVDPLLLFQRISILKTSESELQEYLKFELSPFPLSMFNEHGMRKTQKSKLYELFKHASEDVQYDEKIILENSTVIIDGGFLLHRVIWRQGVLYSDICTSYISYVKKHYGTRVVVVFDGYSVTGTSTKVAERQRRSAIQQSIDVVVSEDIAVSISQDKFLGNDKNKASLISLLSLKMIEESFEVKVAKDDADTKIIQTAVEIACSSPTMQAVVVGEDIDLLVLMAALTPLHCELFFLKPGKQNIETRIYSTKHLQVNLRDHILFLHAFSGCDSTSALFNKGKVHIFKLVNRHKNFEDVIAVFNDPHSSHDAVHKAGCKFFMAVYGAPEKCTSLNEYRYQCFCRYAAKQRMNLASLPPTEDAARQHSYRVYHQVQLWQGVEKTPESWGWRKMDKILCPNPTNIAAAPDALLKMISCKCTKGCGSSCGCKKMGLKCSTICSYCQGISCLNKQPCDDSEDDSEDDIEEIPDNLVEIMDNED